MISGYPLVPRMNRNGLAGAIGACFAFVLRVRDDREVAATAAQKVVAAPLSQEEPPG